MSKGKKITETIESLKYLYTLIVDEGKTDYYDEYTCCYMYISENSKQTMPKKYDALCHTISERYINQ